MARPSQPAVEEERTWVTFAGEKRVAAEVLHLDGTVAKFIFEALKANTVLRSLTIHGFQGGGAINRHWTPNLGDREAELLGKVLAVNTTLTCLNLSVNQITAVGAKEIAEALKVFSLSTSLFFLQDSSRFLVERSVVWAGQFVCASEFVKLCFSSLVFQTTTLFLSQITTGQSDTEKS